MALPASSPKDSPDRVIGATALVEERKSSGALAKCNEEKSGEA
jgi:hypothetical protein